MKNLTLIIICALFCISASVVSNNIFTPAKPKQFYIKDIGYRHKAIEEAKKLHLNGWQNITLIETQVSTVLTAEKY